MLIKHRILMVVEEDDDHVDVVLGGGEGEEGSLGGQPADGLHEVGEVHDPGRLGPARRLRRRPLLLRLPPRPRHLVLRLLRRLGALLLQLPLQPQTNFLILLARMVSSCRDRSNENDKESSMGIN
uniref:Uncharacterized protein n=1 Tax=Triticum urartu TaxID=4572 RepID=A0A8R7V5L3_TRIUA